MTASRILGIVPKALALALATTAIVTTLDAPAFAAVDEKNFEALEYRQVGPFRGGRSTTVAGDPGDHLTFYFGATGGGVWATHNAGQTWDNISDGQFKVGSIGAIAVAPSDSNVIYVGTGSGEIRGVAISTGDGVYRSTDKGKTWVNVGLPNSRTISEIVVDPANPDVVFVAAQGSAWADSEDRGVYRSKDGGKTWSKVLYVDQHTGPSDIVIDATNPRILYATMWDHQRKPWMIRSGGPGSAIYKSTDGGDTWNKIGDGLPELMGKIGVAVSPVSPERVFAIVEAENKKGGLYRSDDGGKSWTLINAERKLYSRSWYYMHVFADPNDENTVYVLDSAAFKSIDGGKTFEPFATAVHGDYHELWINPHNSSYIANANDGGGTITLDGGKTWSTQYNQPTAQIYRVNTDHGYPYTIYGGQQDNSTVAIYSRGPDGGLGLEDFHAVGGCESAHVAFDPDNPRYVYAGCYLGLISEFDQETGLTRSIQLDPTLGAGVSPKDRDYRFNWNAPIAVSIHDPKVIYYAGNVLFKSGDRATTWTPISPDLTRNDPEHQGPMGEPITNEVAEHYNTIFAIAESHFDADTLWAGSDDGLVHVTRDGGQTWQDVTPKRLGEVIINSIETSPHDPATAYVAATGYKNNDHRPMIYKTADYGKRWTSITDGIPDGEFTRVVREDPVRQGLLFAGTERGVYVSFDGGASWQSFARNLPAVPVTDLMINGNDLVLSTQGRSFWVMDDISPLRAVADLGDEAVHLLAPADASYFNTLEAVVPQQVDNPENGVHIDFTVASAEDAGPLTLEILDAAGDVVKTFKSKTKKDKDGDDGSAADDDFDTFEVKDGLNRVTWNFEAEDIKELKGYFNYLRFGSAYDMPPGDYTVRLSYGEASQEQPVAIHQDPRSPVPEFMKGEQYDITLDLYKKIAELHRAIADLTVVKKQVEAKLDLAKKANFPEELSEAGKKLNEAIDAWIATLISKDRSNFQDALNWPDAYLDYLHATYATIAGAIPPLNRNQVAKYEEMMARWPEITGVRDRIIAEDLAGFNNLYSELGLPAVVLPAGEEDQDQPTETPESEDQ